MPYHHRHAAQSFRKIAEACLPLNIAKRITGVEKSNGGEGSFPPLTSPLGLQFHANFLFLPCANPYLLVLPIAGAGK
jgi:hypothetical protein